jgi:biotin synthase
MKKVDNWIMEKLAADSARIMNTIEETALYGKALGELPSLSKLELVIEKLSQDEACPEEFEYLRKLAYDTAHKYFGNKIYMRGLIEFTNVCKNDCFYCGIRRSNKNVERYRLSKEQILACADEGDKLGYRTFVLQGGEDAGFSPAGIADIVESIKKEHPHCAVTLSLGEHPGEVYKMWRQAGADRYLLRHETANPEHYRMLHPEEMSYQNRVRCLWNLKELGYQVGSGFMVGSPYQTPANLAEDLHFLAKLSPQMIGIGPFVPHKDTTFAKEKKGTVRQTLLMISLLRLMFPKALIPSTTSLGTIDATGREKGFLHGANVVMPNLSPVAVREKYQLYDNKICTGEESAQCRGCMDRRAESYGFEIVVDRGDYAE